MLTKRWKLIWRLSLFVFALSLLTASLVAARRHVAESKPAAPVPAIEKRISRGESHFANPLPDKRGLLLRLGRGGFEPAALTIRPGEYFIVVLNASHLRSMSITFQREGGELMGWDSLSRESTRWSFKTQLSPGSYIVTSSVRPEWVCRITVRAN